MHQTETTHGRSRRNPFYHPMWKRIKTVKEDLFVFTVTKANKTLFFYQGTDITAPQLEEPANVSATLGLTDTPRRELGQRTPVSFGTTAPPSSTPNLGAGGLSSPPSHAAKQKAASRHKLTTESSRPDTPRPVTPTTLSVKVKREQEQPQNHQAPQQDQSKQVRAPFLGHRPTIGSGTTHNDQPAPVQLGPAEPLIPTKRRYGHSSGAGEPSGNCDNQGMANVASNRSISHLQLPTTSNSKPSVNKWSSVTSPTASSMDTHARMLSIRDIDSFTDVYKRDLVGRDKALREARTHIEELNATMKHQVLELADTKKYVAHMSDLGKYLLQNRTEYEKRYLRGEASFIEPITNLLFLISLV